MSEVRIKKLKMRFLFLLAITITFSFHLCLAKEVRIHIYCIINYLDCDHLSWLIKKKLQKSKPSGD